MRILYGSDLHLEFREAKCPPIPPRENYDLVILAGDVNLGARGLDWAYDRFCVQDRPVVYVPGNHEYYGYDFDVNNAALASMEALTSMNPDNAQLHVLLPGVTNATRIIDGVRFIGATLWTDLEEPGLQQRMNPNMQYHRDRYIERNVSDFHVIHRGKRRWSANDARETFALHVAYLTTELEKSFDGKTVVITHFMPTRQAIATKYLLSNLNGYFANDLDELMAEHTPDAWVFGHTHDSQELIHRPSGVRLFCNPMGYPGENQDSRWKIFEV